MNILLNRLVIGLFLMTAIGCGKYRNTLRETPPSRTETSNRPKKDAVINQKVVDYAEDLLGSPYRAAGTTPRGFDCSGLTYHVYGHFSVPLQRRSRDQAKMGKAVSMKDVQPGDLVFFGIGTINHVGIVSKVTSKEVYMIHSSSSRGVIETEIFSSDYWSARLRFARRIL